MRSHQLCRGFTMVDTIVSILAGGILLICSIAMTQDAQDEARVLRSMSNLRNLTVAAMTYSAEWNDRQFTLVRDDLAAHGDNLREALANFAETTGEPHSPIPLGWRKNDKGGLVFSALDVSNVDHQRWLPPISFDATPDGSFRLQNVRPFNQYLGGRFYDPVFYAPKDTVPMKLAKPGFDAESEGAPTGDGDLYWSSYSRSPAGMYPPDVFAAPLDPDQPQNRGQAGGFRDPFSFDAGFRSPSMSQARFPDLKTHFIEHHWLQNRPEGTPECNEAIKDGRYGGCEPHYFNHSALSEPACAFYDGHVELLRVADVLDADRRVREQVGYGLWLRKPGGATDGYFESMALDETRTSFHIFTTDGIKGRDVIR